MARKEKKYHIIYKTTNLLSGKYYIGMHSTDDLNDGYLGSGKRLKYSVNKYGKENHKREIIEFCDSREELISREEEIVNLNEIAKEECINLRVGGDSNGNYGYYMSEEHKLKIGLANSGENNGMYGKRFEMKEKHRKNISNALKNSVKFKKSRASDDYKNKISNAFSVPIYVLDKELNVIEEFPNMTSASDFFNCKESNVFNARRDKRMIKRRYWVIYKEDYKQFKKERNELTKVQ